MATQTQTQNESETLFMKYVSPADCVFYKNPQGFLALTLRGENYGRVALTRALPLSMPDRYICITDMESNELGILESIADFPADIRVMMEEELKIRYYCPEITEILSVKEKMGFYYFDVKIKSFKKTVAVKDISRNIKQLGESRIMLTDADGNRYLIPDLAKVNKKSRQQIEPYLY